MEEEIWKDIIWYEWLYKISSHWNVLSLFDGQRKRNKMLSPWKSSSNGLVYFSVLLANKKNYKTLKVHRLVAMMFVDNPENLPIVMHWDNDTLNNYYKNLKWGTQKQNMEQMSREWRHWFLWKKWLLCNYSKIVYQYDKALNFIKEWNSLKDVQRELWISQWNISKNCLWELKSAGWFVWSYNKIII